MDKNKVLEKLEKGWGEFTDSFSDLTEGQMTQTPHDGGWSIKDILAHVRAWEEEALKYLPLITEGKRLPRYKDLYGGIDAFNALVQRENKEKPLNKTLEDLAETHRRLLDYLKSVPETQYLNGARFRRRLAADTLSHYPQHTRTILDMKSG